MVLRIFPKEEFLKPMCIMFAMDDDGEEEEVTLSQSVCCMYLQIIHMYQKDMTIHQVKNMPCLVFGNLT